MMKISLVVLLAFLACAFAATLKWDEVDSTFTFAQYLKHFGKSYSDPKEYQMRKAIFEENLSNILAHNQDTTKTWKQAVNHLADITPEEFKRLRGYSKKLGYAKKEKARINPNHISVKPADALPTSVDWRQQGVVTAVKDQGDCGSCWSFATAETIESHVALANKQLWDLSEQQILDCTSNPNNCGGTGGCEGGTVEVAMDSIIAMGGIMSEWTYPYLSHGGQDFKTCNFDNSTPPAATIAKYINLPSNEYLPLLTAVATIGPIAISVDASSWQFYSTGVYNGCNQTYPDLDHAVQLVGYGTESGGDYWLVRNSWTPAWGEEGYIKLYRTSTVQCGTDITPGDGEGCTNGPSSVTVCGTCGILYDTLYPLIG